MSQDKQLGTRSPRGTWVQTERKAHEAWAALVGKNPKSAQLMHLLVANMDRQGAVVISQRTLAEMMGCSVDTIKRAMKPLRTDNWIDVVRIGSGRGGVNAYVVNRRVAWGDKRENQQYAIFDARIIVSAQEQEDSNLLENKEDLRALPTMGFGDIQSPAGEGEEPPSQPALPDMEPDLPSIHED